MQADHVRRMRRRKLELYASLLPPNALPSTISDLSDNADYAAVLIEVARVAPPCFGLTVGRHRSLSDLGFLGHVTMSCATLGEVFELWRIYAESAGELVIFDAAADYDDGDGNWSILIKPFPYLPRSVANLLTDELCATFFVFAREITGRDFAEFNVELSHAPVAGGDYGIAFPGQVSFNAAVTRVIGPATALDLPVRSLAGDPITILIDQLGEDRSELQRMKPVTMQIHDFLIRRRGAAATLGAAASALRLSQRTLVRRLASEGTTFGTELDEFRRRYAMSLAHYGGLKAKQIAHLVGFQSENALRKAFKKWTGLPIGAWLRRASDTEVVQPLDRTRQSGEIETSMHAHDISGADA